MGIKQFQDRVVAIEDYIGQTWFGKAIDKVVDGLNRYTGVDSMVAKMDQSRLFNSRGFRYGRSQYTIKAGYTTGTGCIVYGIIVNPFFAYCGSATILFSFLEHLNGGLQDRVKLASPPNHN